MHHSVLLYVLSVCAHLVMVLMHAQPCHTVPGTAYQQLVAWATTSRDLNRARLFENID